MKETPFSVGLGLTIHKTQSKAIINMLAELDLSIDYQKAMKIETDIANAVTEKMEESNGKYIPPSIQPGLHVYFAVDNCDFKNDTPDRKNEFHGTAQIVYQKSIEGSSPYKLKIEGKQRKSFISDPFPIDEVCPKPVPPNVMYTTCVPDMSDVQLYNTWDSTWFFTKTLHNREDDVLTPTWAAYNSLITPALPTTTYCGLPLYPGSPTDWSNLYESLKICQHISTVISPSSKTIISLNLQLYSKVLQLLANYGVKQHFVFQPRELHIVFAVLHAMGKYIECSGLDQILVEAGIYGQTTLDPILRGKQMKRELEAHMILYLALHKKYMAEFFTKQPQTENKLRLLISMYLMHFEGLEKDDHIFLNTKHDELVQDLLEFNIFKSLNSFDDQLQHQQKFYSCLFEQLAKDYEIFTLHLFNLWCHTFLYMIFRTMHD